LIRTSAQDTGRRNPVSHIAPVPDDADGDAAELFDADREAVGYVHNYTRLFARRPDVYAAWAQLNGAIKGGMDLRRYELATIAAARQLRSSYCTIAHGQVLAKRFLEPAQVADLVADRSTEAVDELEVAVMDLAEKVAADPTSVTPADVDRLLALGASEDDVFSVVLAAAARCFFSSVLEGLGVAPDAQYADELPPDLAEALTVGRPIAAKER
jgi:uncharacterized peroxidase-related enzyme